MSGRRSRFERLERPRDGGPDGDERPAAEERFSGISGGGETPATRAPGSAGDRFREPEARPPDVAAPGEDEQPFIRCRRCETDNSRYARACTTCGDDLHSAEQRAFNADLWARRREERAEEEKASAELRRAQIEAAAEASRARRAAAEELARQAGHRERERLDREEWGGGRWGDPWGGGFGDGDRTPVALRLLRRIQDPRWRLAAIGGYVGLVLLFFALSFVSQGFLVVSLLLLVLLLPGGTWRVRRRWWW